MERSFLEAFEDQKLGCSETKTLFSVFLCVSVLAGCFYFSLFQRGDQKLKTHTGTIIQVTTCYL